MAANTAPIFSVSGNILGLTTGLTANTALDGTGSVVTIFTAGANGSRVERTRLLHLGSNIATVVRFFVNNGGVNSTAANNFLMFEVTMAANTLSQTAASLAVETLWQMVLPAGYKINVTIGTAIASGIMATAIGGNY